MTPESTPPCAAPAYHCQSLPVAALDTATRAAMCALYLSVYEASSPALFAADLAAKDEVLLLHADGALVGFTTLKLSACDWHGQPLRVVYSGDTVVAPAHWGQTALSFAWVRRLGEIQRQHPTERLLWLLLVKGHRTYRYLHVFARRFFPHEHHTEPELAALAATLAAQAFPEDYQPATGLVAFEPSRGQLRPELAEPRPDELGRPGVAYFLARNPGFRRGHELVCLCEVSEANMKPLTLRLFREGLRNSDSAAPRAAEPRRHTAGLDTMGTVEPPPAQPPAEPTPAWLDTLLARNAGCAYLQAQGAPRTLSAFRAQVPVVDHEHLRPWLARLAAGEPDVLFAGAPVAWERTGGSAGGAKLIPYSAHGLHDFQAALVPWLAEVVAEHHITGRVYLATSPATRPPETIAGLPLGLPDGAYLGEQWGHWVMQHSAVPLAVGALTDVAEWRRRTLDALRHAPDLELISVWSPTFLLRLLDELLPKGADARRLWPRLKLVSCWMDAASAAPAAELQRRLPHAQFQPKGLMATEGVVSVPDAAGHARLTPHGFFEFLPLAAPEDTLCAIPDTTNRANPTVTVEPAAPLLADALQAGACYEVILTTASGLYRYRTGDVVRCEAASSAGPGEPPQPCLRFLGRTGVNSDLVGEKLTEAFVATALAQALPGACVASGAFLAPGTPGTPSEPGAGSGTHTPHYWLVCEASQAPTPQALATLDAALGANPQYAYARRLGQLGPLALWPVAGLQERLVAAQLARGVRLADVKPLALLPAARLAEGWLGEPPRRA